MPIYGNMIGGSAPLKTLIMTDEAGNEIMGVVTGSEVLLTANATTDIREGTVAVTDNGIETGSAIIPNYYTTTGQKVIMPNSAFVLKLPLRSGYDYTEMQCIICQFNTSLDDSVAASQVVIGDNVYNSNSTAVVATLIKNEEEQSVDFNLTNTSGTMYILRYFTYKELY